MSPLVSVEVNFTNFSLPLNPTFQHLYITEKGSEHLCLCGQFYMSLKMSHTVLTFQ